MTKADLANEVSKKTGVEKAAAMKIIEASMEVIKDSIASGENVYLRGFGTFLRKKRAKKVGRNISKKEPVIIPERHMPVFKPSRKFVAKLQ